MDDGHSTAEDVWRRKTDAEVTAAAAKLGDYTEVGQQIIRDELDRRQLPITEEDVRVGEEAAAIARRWRGIGYIALGNIVSYVFDLLSLTDSDLVYGLVGLVAGGLQLYGVFALITGWRARPASSNGEVLSP